MIESLISKLRTRASQMAGAPERRYREALDALSRSVKPADESAAIDELLAAGEAVGKSTVDIEKDLADREAPVPTWLAPTPFWLRCRRDRLLEDLDRNANAMVWRHPLGTYVDGVFLRKRAEPVRAVDPDKVEARRKAIKTEHDAALKRIAKSSPDHRIIAIDSKNDPNLGRVDLRRCRFERSPAQTQGEFDELLRQVMAAVNVRIAFTGR